MVDLKFVFLSQAQKKAHARAWVRPLRLHRRSFVGFLIESCLDDIISGLVIVGENGSGDNYGIGCSESFSIIDIARAFGSEIEMLPERKGNRMNAEVVCTKIKALGWEERTSVMDYIASIVNKK